MHKSIVILIIIAFMFTICSCGSMQSSQEENPVNASLGQDNDSQLETIQTHDTDVTSSDSLEERILDEVNRLMSEQLQYPSQNDEFKFDIYETHAIITAYIGTQSDVTIPEVIESLPVKIIGPSCFGAESKTTINKVTISKNLIYVDGGFAQVGASGNGSNLSTIVFPSDKKVYFGPGSFFYCTALTDINDILLHMANSKIEVNTFSGCGITSVSIPDWINEIGEKAFYGCRQLSVVDLGNVSTIGEKAFSYVPIRELFVRNPQCDLDLHAFYNTVWGDNKEPVFPDNYVNHLVIHGLPASTAAQFASKYSTFVDSFILFD